MALSVCDFETTFQFGASPKTFSFKDVTDYASQGVGLGEVTGVFKITDPAGNVIYNNTDFTDPDIDPDVILTSVKTIALPLDANGNVLLGDYVITYTVRGSSGTIDPAVDVSKTYTHTISYTSPTVSLNLTANCIKPLMQSTDQTNYTSGTTDPTITRSHKIHYPAALNKADITGTGKTLETNVFYTQSGTTLTHSSSLTSTLSYSFGNNLFITDSVSGTKYVDVACDGELCDVYCCIKAEWDRYTSVQGINDEKANDYLANWIQMIGLANQIRIALECGKDTHITTFVNRILDLGNCESGCGCSDGDPQLVTGLGGGVDTFVVDSAGTPITVTSATSGMTTTYTITMDSTFVAKVNNSYNTTVSAGSNVTVTPTTDSGGNKDYKVDFNDTSTEPDIKAFLVTITSNAGTHPTIAVSGVSKYGSAFNGSATVASDNLTSDYLSKNGAFTISDFWASQGSKVYKVATEIIEHSRARVGQNTGALSTNGVRKLRPEVYLNNGANFKLRFVDSDGIPVTGNDLNDFVNLKLHIILTA